MKTFKYYEKAIYLHNLTKEVLQQMRIGVLTGGGDCPGLNAAIRAIIRTASLNGIEVIGLREGWKGILEKLTMDFNPDEVDELIRIGGTILKSSRTNPLKVPNSIRIIRDNMASLGIDALVAIGGDDTLGAALELHNNGIPVVGIPKTIDKDICVTDFTIGFDSAANFVCESLDRLRTTARSHSRAIVVEVMGRHSGWVAVAGGIAGGADYILIPERSFTIGEIVNMINRKKRAGQDSFIIVVAEGAKLGGDINVTIDDQKDQFGHEHLGGIGKFVERELKKQAFIDTRYVSLGHTQRGGPPTAFDRILATRLAVRAIDLVRDKKFGRMVALKGPDIIDVDLVEGVGKTNAVNGDWYDTARVFF